MGTVADKLAYLKGTKKAIAQAIEAKEVSVPASTSFRNYANLIEQIQTGKTSNLQVGLATPTGKNFTLHPDEGYDGFSGVIIEGDENLKPENIAEGIPIYGVTGTLKSGGGEADVPPPAEYQTYVNKAKTIYTGDYAGLLIFDDGSYVGICFLMDNFAITNYVFGTTEITMTGAYYCRYTRKTRVWDSLDYRNVSSDTNTDGGHFTINIKFATRTLYCDTQQVWPTTYGTANVYGVDWNGLSDILTRTDDAIGFSDPVPYMSGISDYGSPFDNCLPWSGMKVSERDGGKVVAIPKFWYKLTQDGVGIKIQIADAPVAGFSVSPAHMDRGDGLGERSVVYIGRYHCRVSDFKSYGGSKPKTIISRINARDSIHTLGSSIWQIDFAMFFTLWLLYIVEFANWNSQATIGYGCGNGSSSSVENMGYTDGMPYHTGTMKTSRTEYGCSTQYRNIEGLWENCFDWADGSYANSSGLNIIINPNEFSDAEGGVTVGVPIAGTPKSYEYTNVEGAFPLFIGSNNAVGDEGYSLPDSWMHNGTRSCIGVGGCYSNAQDYGLFYVYTQKTSTSSSVGCRLMELP